MRFAITTLGCKVNQYDSQRIREALVNTGHVEQSFSSPGADCYIINTCSVTHRSDAEGRKLIRQALRNRGRVIVTGCQSVVYPYDIMSLSDQIELVPPPKMGNHLGVNLPCVISRFGGHSRAFVKVQSGCNNFCTYCIVPHARGKPKSRHIEDIIEEINILDRNGYKEVVLCGINIGLFEGGLVALIRTILKNTSIPRIRISSVEPWTFEDELIELAAEDPRVCKHLHLPLQSGSDKILSGMGRPYSADYFRNLVAKVRSASRGITIGTDVMVGFPGEDAACFQETWSVLNESDITYMHVFPYSVRSGTPAATFSHQVDAATKKDRSKRLRELSFKKREAFIRSQLGSTEQIIVTQENRGLFSGVSSNYIRIHVPCYAPEYKLMRVRLDDYVDGIVTGSPCG